MFFSSQPKLRCAFRWPVALHQALRVCLVPESVLVTRVSSVCCHHGASLPCRFVRLATVYLMRLVGWADVRLCRVGWLLTPALCVACVPAALAFLAPPPLRPLLLSPRAYRSPVVLVFAAMPTSPRSPRRTRCTRLARVTSASATLFRYARSGMLLWRSVAILWPSVAL